MENVFGTLWVGDLDDCRKADGGIAIIHACKHPCFDTQSPTRLLYRIVKSKDSMYELYLNMIDHPTSMPAKFCDPMFEAALEFVQDKVERGCRVLVHCNQGHSRAPSIALVYLAVNGTIPNGSYRIAAEAFEKIYPLYRPGGGIAKYMRKHWDKLMEMGA